MDFWTDPAVREGRNDFADAFQARAEAFQRLLNLRWAYRAVVADQAAHDFLAFSYAVERPGAKALRNGRLVDVEISGYADMVSQEQRERLDVLHLNIEVRKQQLPSVASIESAHRDLAAAIATYESTETSLANSVLEQQSGELELTLGKRPLDPKKASLWFEGVKALISGEAVRNYWFRTSAAGKDYVNQRRIARARHANGIAVERRSMPDLGALYREQTEASLDFARVAGEAARATGDVVESLHQERERLGDLLTAAHDNLERGRHTAQRVCVSTEPELVISRTGRPADTAEDLALWAPVAAHWVEALSVLTTSELRDCLSTTGEQIESTAYRQLGKSMGDWLWWKVEASRLPEFQTNFDIMTSPHVMNSLYLPPSRNDIRLS